ncbi:MAG: tRNA (adenosine(37)-N6)-threonylcarbamoyltransferase complex ATPase subunit type 1 TsaE [Gammaproteobacteria bacterium]|nr:tRNA (adenosine(37)-N6)-threonylcarbamoyltransferase complex ATPase subunit type 1 TsaE [Gammaproteobacteria bacterium]MBU1655001.1 tRNA (adenosine(37)-N6)-threonylcarbamoyltransferase complex ATPase subunit type 1 TsaE [Gammaproteobacteria bacterium]MBU1960022.1 tRNA (adenosine(37)-N6)-threonylcarbamoyltransferase complex ATPase subunit type 1 TsaE [Gammaproteobacteria bacterium]
MLSWRIQGTEAQIGFGALLAGLLVDGLVIYLEGDLGAGKTTLVRGLLRGLGHAGTVRSPTYSLLEDYRLADRSIHHLDLYRLADPEELEYLGIRDICDGRSILLVEWPDKGRGVLPVADLVLRIRHAGVARILELVPGSKGGEYLADRLSALALPAGVTRQSNNVD